MDLLPIITKIIGGSFTGYSTNLLAIKMLFREFGPFGGVIVKTKKEFIQKISALVEREAINHRTLEEVIERESFQDLFGVMVEDLLGQHLSATIGPKKWKDIEGLEESIENLLHLFKEEGHPFLEDALTILLESLPAEDFAKRDQLERVMKRFQSHLLTVLEEGSVIQQTFWDLLKEEEERTLYSFIPEEMIAKGVANLQELIEDLHQRMREELNEDLDDTFDRIYEHLNIEEVLKELEVHIGEKSLVEMLKIEKREDLTRDILERLTTSLRRPEGRHSLQELLEILLHLLKGLDISPLNLLNQDLREGLVDFLERELPSLIYTAIRWIRENKEELEDLIDTTIEERLEAGTGLKNWMKKRIVSSFMSVSKEYRIITKVLEDLESNVDPYTLAQEITDGILSLLKEKTFKELAESLENQGILKETELADRIIEQLEALPERMDLTLFNQIFYTPLKELGFVHIVEDFQDEIKTFLREQGKERLVYNKERVSTLSQRTIYKVQEILDKELSQILDQEETEGLLRHFKEKILQSFYTREEELTQHLTREASSFFQGKNLLDLMQKENLTELTYLLQGLILHKTSETLEDFQRTRVKDSLQQLERLESSSHQLGDLLLAYGKENMESLLSGRIEHLIAINLHSLSDEEIQKRVEDFLGTELKPITTLGAMMGSMAGLGLYALQGTALLELPPLSHYLLSAFIYGGVGYVTNRVAIQMVFKPYQRKKILGKTIPFTPGLVAKNKPRFARGLGDFIEENLLSAETIETLFKEHREEIKEGIKGAVSKNDYQLIEDLSLRNQERIAEYAIDSLLKALSREGEDLFFDLAQRISGIELKALELTKIENEIEKRGRLLFLESKHAFSKPIYQGLKSSRSIGESIPAPILSWIIEGLEEEMREEIHTYKNLLEDRERLEEYLTREEIEEGFNHLLESKIKDLLGDEGSDLESRFLHGLTRVLYSESFKKRLMDLIEGLVLNQIDPKARIDSLFHGLFKGFFEENTGLLLSKIYALFMRSLKSKRDVIVDQTLNAVQENLSPIQWIGFQLLETQQTIEEVIDDLINTKVPTFFQSKRDELEGILHKTMRGFGEKRVEELGITIEREGLDRVLSSLLKQEVVISGLEQLLSYLLHRATEMGLGSFFEILSIDTTDQLTKTFYQELEILRRGLYKGIVAKDDLLCKEISTMMQKGVHSLILSKPLYTLTRGISQEEVQSLLSTTIDRVYQSRAFHHGLNTLVKDLFEVLDRRTLGDFIHEETLRRDIDQSLSTFLFSQETPSLLLPPMRDLIHLFAESSRDILERRTREEVLEILVESTLMSVEKNLHQLVDSVDVSGITIREIEKMDPKQIEDLFYSFAKEYLHRVIRFGWAGSGIGLFTEFIS